MYHLSDLVRLTAFHYRTGKEIWSLELRESFDADGKLVEKEKIGEDEEE